MSDTEIVNFPKKAKRTQEIEVHVRLHGDDLDALIAFAKTLGCSLNDAAGRKLRYALRVPPEGGAA